MSPEKIPSPEAVPNKIELSKKIIPLKDEFINRYGPVESMTKFKNDEQKQLFLRVAIGAEKIGEERRSFWNMLVTEVAKTDYRPPQDRPTQILDVGCGRCMEGIVLNSYFGGGHFGFNSNNVELKGIDLDPENIKKAEAEHMIMDYPNSTKYVPKTGYEFIRGDATDLEKYEQLPEQFDVIMVRHQQISDSEQTWVKIFQEALKRLAPDGIIISTSFSDIEHDMLVEQLKKLDCEILVNEANPYAVHTSVKEVSIDRDVVIIKKISKK